LLIAEAEIGVVAVAVVVIVDLAGFVCFVFLFNCKYLAKRQQKATVNALPAQLN
jgi:hypothetical protein